MADQYEAVSASGSADYDALYNHGLVLQELAGKIPMNQPEHAKLLQQVRG